MGYNLEVRTFPAVVDGVIETAESETLGWDHTVNER